MNQNFGPVLEEYFDLGSVLYGGSDAEAEAWMLQNIARRVAVSDGVVFGGCHILPLQQHLISVRPAFRLFFPARRSLPSRRLARRAGFVTML